MVTSRLQIETSHYFPRVSSQLTDERDLSVRHLIVVGAQNPAPGLATAAATTAGMAGPLCPAVVVLHCCTITNAKSLASRGEEEA